MRGDLQRMIEAVARHGRVTWIGLRPERRAELVRTDRVELTGDGLVGDHASGGKRAVSILQAEHLAVIASFLGRGEVTPQDLRRNILVQGINLASLKGREMWIGTALLRITGICAPCSRMEETLGHGGYAAVRGHGGWCAEILKPGHIALGNRVQPGDTSPDV